MHDGFAPFIELQLNDDIRLWLGIGIGLLLGSALGCDWRTARQSSDWRTWRQRYCKYGKFHIYYRPRLLWHAQRTLL